MGVLSDLVQSSLLRLNIRRHAAVSEPRRVALRRDTIPPPRLRVSRRVASRHAVTSH